MQVYSLFEPKVITFLPALDGLLLSRDHVRFQSHTISTAISPENLGCGYSKLVLSAEEQELRCPLCVDNADVVRVMEDAAEGCKSSEKAIKRRKQRVVVKEQKVKKQEERFLKIRREAEEKVQVEQTLRKERKMRRRKQKRIKEEETRKIVTWNKGMVKGSGKLMFSKMGVAMDGTADSGWDSNGFRGGRSELEDAITGYTNMRCANMGCSVTGPHDNIVADPILAEELNQGKSQRQWIGGQREVMKSAGLKYNHTLKKFENADMHFGMAISDSSDVEWVSSPKNRSDFEMGLEACGSTASERTCEERNDGIDFHV